MSGRARRLWTAGLLLPVALVVLFSDLGRASFSGDEALYVAVTLETAASGRLLPLEVDGGTYVSKPIGGFLLLGAAFRALGPTELAARLPSASAALALVLLVGDAGARWLGGGSGLLAGLFLLSARQGLEFHGFRSGTFDALLVLLVTVVVALWVESRRREAPRLWRAAWATGALAVLVKYLAGPALAATAIVVGELLLPSPPGRPRWRRAGAAAGALLAAGGVVYGAYLALQHRLGATDLFGELVERDLVQRAQGELHRFRQPGVAYFAAEIGADYGVALLLLVPFALGLWRRLRDDSFAPGERIAWAGIAGALLGPLVAVSLFQSRLPWYSLPAHPGLALALSAGVAELRRSGVRASLVAALVALCSALRLTAAFATLQEPAAATPLRAVARALDEVPEARFHVPPDFVERATSRHGIIRPQSYVYLRLLAPRTARVWPPPDAPCALLYTQKPALRELPAGSYDDWRRLELPRWGERDANRYVLLERCGGRLLARIGGDRFLLATRPPE